MIAAFKPKPGQAPAPRQVVEKHWRVLDAEGLVSARPRHVMQRVREAPADQHGISERRMFGGSEFMQPGHMLVGVVKDAMKARVGASAAGKRARH